MRDEWFYAAQGQQKGPVSGAELQHLADSNELRPTDLIWKEGLPQWVPAASIEGLFAAGQPAASAPAPAGSFLPAPLPTVAPDEPLLSVLPVAPARLDREEEPEQQRAPQRRRRVDEEDEDEDVGPRRLAPRRSLSMKMVLIVAGGGGMLLLLGCAGGLYFFFHYLFGSSYAVVLGPHSEQSKTVQFSAGTTAEIRVISEDNTDVDLYVYSPNNTLVTQDIRPDKNCYVSFRVPQTGSYRLRVVNLDRFRGNRCTVYYTSR